MSNFTNDTQDNILCHCSGTSKEKIMVLIEEGFVTLDDISRKTGACSGCGSCEYSVIELLDECN